MWTKKHMMIIAKDDRKFEREVKMQAAKQKLAEKYTNKIESKSILLDLYKQREQATNTANLISIQTSIDQIIAQNYLNYVNR